MAIAFALGVAQCFASLAVAENPPAAALCSAFVGRVDAFDATNTRYAAALFTHDGTHAVSGTLALYHGDDRYDVRFESATAADPRERDATPSPIVVHFDTPVDVEAALVVTSESTGCAPREPWRRNFLYVTGQIGAVSVGGGRRAPLGPPLSNPAEAIWVRFHAAAANAAQLTSEPVVREPHVDCARPNVPATTAFVAEPTQLESSFAHYGGGRVDILVTLDATGAVVKTRVEQGSGSIDIDRGALDDAAASKFRAGSFHCRSYGGSYIFTAYLR